MQQGGARGGDEVRTAGGAQVSPDDAPEARRALRDEERAGALRRAPHRGGRDGPLEHHPERPGHLRRSSPRRHLVRHLAALLLRFCCVLHNGFATCLLHVCCIMAAKLLYVCPITPSFSRETVHSLENELIL